MDRGLRLWPAPTTSLASTHSITGLSLTPAASCQAQVRLCISGASSSSKSGSFPGATGDSRALLLTSPFLPHSHPQPWKDTNTQTAAAPPCSPVSIQVSMIVFRKSYEYVLSMLGTSRLQAWINIGTKTKYNIWVGLWETYTDLMASEKHSG